MKSWFVILCLILAVLFCVAGYSYDQPGNFGFAYRTEDIAGFYETMENSRIYYPDSSGTIPQSASPCPIIVLGHGFMMGIDRYFSYGEHLASWGHIVVLPTFSNPFLEPENTTHGPDAW